MSFYNHKSPLLKMSFLDFCVVQGPFLLAAYSMHNPLATHSTLGTRFVCDPADTVGRISLVRLDLVKQC